jgi:hypothetical protein
MLHHVVIDASVQQPIYQRVPYVQREAVKSVLYVPVLNALASSMLAERCRLR